MFTAHTLLNNAIFTFREIQKLVQPDGRGAEYAGHSSGAGTLSDFWTIGSVRVGVTTDYSSPKSMPNITTAFSFGIQGGCCFAVSFRWTIDDDDFYITGGLGLGGEEGSGGKHLAAVSALTGFRPTLDPQKGDGFGVMMRFIKQVADYARTVATQEAGANVT
jgi:hypothetical protein